MEPDEVIEGISLTLSTEQANDIVDGGDDELSIKLIELISEAINRAGATQQPTTITLTVNP